MTKLLIIAGPQSSGKTTAFNYLKNKYTNFLYLEEVNPYKLKGRSHKGAAFTSRQLESRIIDADLQLLKKINGQSQNNKKTTVMETGIFHLVYSEYFCGRKLTADFFIKYLNLHKAFYPHILFLDTKPDVSWRRRYQNYLKRIDPNQDLSTRLNILEKYQKTIYDLYPLWLKWYEKIPFEKLMIKNSYKNLSVFKQEVLEKLEVISKPPI